MTRLELNRAVARATGEDLATVRRRGFQIAVPIEVCDYDSDSRAPQFIDWDSLQAPQEQRRALFP
jgi:hypothetical protein